MNQQKKNAEDAKILSLQLNEIDEIEQKVEYYKSIIKAFSELSDNLSKKIEILSKEETIDKIIECSKLKIEKLNTDSNIFEKKKFFEMWLKRKSEYDKKFESITKECNEKFDEINKKAEKIAQSNIKFKSVMDRFSKEENVSQKLKNEYYLMLKNEVIRHEGKGVFLEI